MNINHVSAVLAACDDKMEQVSNQRNNVSKRNLPKIHSLTEKLIRLRSLRSDYIHLGRGFTTMNQSEWDELCELLK